MRWFLPLIVVLVVALDQASKTLVTFYLREWQSVPVIAGAFHLTLIHNTGIAFGFFHGSSQWLSWLIGAGILVLSYLAFRMRNESLVLQISIGFILGGAIGNMIDRMTQGAVIDFLDFRIWPVFNLADSFITVGVGLLMLSVIQRSSPKQRRL